MGRGHGGSRVNGPSFRSSDSTMSGYSSTLAKAVKEREDEIRGMDVEFSSVFDTQGNEVFRAKGDSNSVSTSNTTDNIVTHNHPSGGSFSQKDIESVLYGNEKEIRAVGGNYTYSLKRPEKGWNRSHMTAYKKAKAFVNAQDAAFENKYKGDYWTAFRRMNSTHEHRVMKEFAKQMGYSYTKQRIQ